MPKKITVKEKYRLLGIADDDQRGLVHKIITNSAAGQWTRFADFDSPDPLPIMRTIINNDRFGIKTRVINNCTEFAL